MTALFGPSGCGKTTVLRCIAGLLRINGVCEIDGEVWQDENGAFLPTHKRPLGYVFQEASLFQHLSVRRNLLFGAPRKDRGNVKDAIVFDEVVELLGIERLLDRSPRNLSGGERQRVAIGRALLSQPKLLLMDEPLSALDRATKNEILPFLERLRDRLDLPVVYITHDIAEVERLADQMVLMEKGRVIGFGPLEELQSDPSLPLAAARDAAVSLDGIVQASDEAYGLVTLKVRGGSLTAPAPPAAGWRAAAHSRHCRRREPHARSAWSKLDPERPAGADRVDEAGRLERGRGRCRAWGGRRRRAPPVAPHAKVMGGPWPWRRGKRLRAGQGGRARAGARRVGVRRSPPLTPSCRLDLAKVSKATASTMITPMTICWM